MAKTKFQFEYRNPKRAVISRETGVELDRLFETLRDQNASGWVVLKEFREFPRQARSYCNRMKSIHRGKGEFSSSIESDGVGRLYARLIPSASASSTTGEGSR